MYNLAIGAECRSEMGTYLFFFSHGYVHMIDFENTHQPTSNMAVSLLECMASNSSANRSRVLSGFERMLKLCPKVYQDLQYQSDIALRSSSALFGKIHLRLRSPIQGSPAKMKQKQLNMA